MKNKKKTAKNNRSYYSPDSFLRRNRSDWLMSRVPRHPEYFFERIVRDGILKHLIGNTKTSGFTFFLRTTKSGGCIYIKIHFLCRCYNSSTRGFNGHIAIWRVHFCYPVKDGVRAEAIPFPEWGTQLVNLLVQSSLKAKSTGGRLVEKYP